MEANKGNLMEQDYINGCEPYYDMTESQNEAAAYHQIALDALYRIGCQYSINMADSALLCQLAQIDFNELQKYSGTPAAC